MLWCTTETRWNEPHEDSKPTEEKTNMYPFLWVDDEALSTGARQSATVARVWHAWWLIVRDVLFGHKFEPMGIKFSGNESPDNNQPQATPTSSEIPSASTEEMPFPNIQQPSPAFTCNALMPNKEVRLSHLPCLLSCFCVPSLTILFPM